jgi:hypothetical protein
VYPFGPTAGAAVNLVLFSYADQANIGATIDPAAVTDPGGLMEGLRQGFDEVRAIGK